MAGVFAARSPWFPQCCYFSPLPFNFPARCAYNEPCGVDSIGGNGKGLAQAFIVRFEEHTMDAAEGKW